MELAREDPSGVSSQALRLTVAVIALIVMQAALLAPWLALLSQGRSSSELAVMAGLWGVGVGAALVEWVTARWNLKPEVRMGLDGLALGISLGVLTNLAVQPDRGLAPLAGLARLLQVDLSLSSMPYELFILAAALLVWRNGRRQAAGETLDPGRTGFRFRAGVLLFALYISASKLIGPAPLPATLPFFFGGSLMAMSLTRVERMNRLRGAAETPFTAGWMGNLAILFLGTLAVGLLIGVGLQSGPAYQVLSLLQALVLVLLDVLYVVLRPVFVLLAPIFNWLFQQIALLLLSLGRTIEGALTGETPPPAGEVFGDLPPPPFVADLLFWIGRLGEAWPSIRTVLIVLAVALLLWFTVRANRQRSTRRGAGPDRDRGEVLAPEGFLSGLRSRLDAARFELERLGRAVLGGQIVSVIAIRRIYSRLLRLAAENGRPRKRAETPIEFERALVRLYPQAGASVETITRAYVEVRYGEVPEDPETLARVRQAWTTVRRAAQGKLD